MSAEFAAVFDNPLQLGPLRVCPRFITADMIKEVLPPPGDDTLVLMCGPPPMIEFACKKNLEALGYPKTSMVNF